MAGFSTMYVLGGAGGFMGGDGVGAIEMVILQGEGNRQWLEPRYFDESWGRWAPSVALPRARHPDALIDACIAFCPRLLPFMPLACGGGDALGKEEMLDFNAEPRRIPVAWSRCGRRRGPFTRAGNLAGGPGSPRAGMKRQYLGDSRDSFKWDYHHFLVPALGLGKLQVVWMMTTDDGGGDGKTAPELFPARREILGFCNALRDSRDPRELARLPATTGESYKVTLVGSDGPSITVTGIRTSGGSNPHRASSSSTPTMG